MTARKNQDVTHLSGLTFDNVYEDELSPRYLESQLCIPMDRLEDIEFFPNFADDSIRLSEVMIPELDSLTCFDDIGCKHESVDDRELFFREQEIDRKGRNLKISSPHFDNNKLCISLEQGMEQQNYGTALRVSSQLNKINNDDIGCSNVLFAKKKKPRSKRPRKENQSLMFPSFDHQLKTTKRRRCIHCQAEETPQWRMGPMGRNTLCNACGLRYKSGRLLPEYRPAASPSFDITKHSNFYRKIVQRKLCEEDNPAKVMKG